MASTRHHHFILSDVVALIIDLLFRCISMACVYLGPLSVAWSWGWSTHLGVYSSWIFLLTVPPLPGCLASKCAFLFKRWLVQSLFTVLSVMPVQACLVLVCGCPSNSMCYLVLEGGGGLCVCCPHRLLILFVLSCPGLWALHRVAISPISLISVLCGGCPASFLYFRGTQ